MFTPHELRLLLCGEQAPSWTREDILNYTEPKHGYNKDRCVLCVLCVCCVQCLGECMCIVHVYASPILLTALSWCVCVSPMPLVRIHMGECVLNILRYLRYACTYAHTHMLFKPPRCSYNGPLYVQYICMLHTSFIILSPAQSWLPASCECLVLHVGR